MKLPRLTFLEVEIFANMRGVGIVRSGANYETWCRKTGKALESKTLFEALKNIRLLVTEN